MGKNVSRRLFIDQYCFGILNHLLTNDDFKSKNLSANNITVIDGNEKDLNFISKVNEEVFFYIVKPEKMIFNVIIQIHLMLKGMKENSIHNIIFIPCENYDIHSESPAYFGDFFSDRAVTDYGKIFSRKFCCRNREIRKSRGINPFIVFNCGVIIPYSAEPVENIGENLLCNSVR